MIFRYFFNEFFVAKIFTLEGMEIQYMISFMVNFHFQLLFLAQSSL